MKNCPTVNYTLVLTHFIRNQALCCAVAAGSSYINPTYLYTGNILMLLHIKAD